MSKSLLIYERAVPVNRDRHRGWGVKSGDNYDFARDVNSMPLLGVEFRSAAGEYPIVFSGSNEQVMPAILLGIRESHNFFVDDAGTWEARYIPAFARRYPFVFSSSDNGETLTLCIDEEFSGINQQGDGERLFDDQGERTPYLNKVLEFQQEFQKHYRRTQEFCNRLKELNLLEPAHAQFKFDSGEKMSLSGFSVVNRDRLRELDGDKLSQLAVTDELELIYLHLMSLNNIYDLAGRAGMDDWNPGSHAHEDTGSSDSNDSGKKKGRNQKKPASKKGGEKDK